MAHKLLTAKTLRVENARLLAPLTKAEEAEETKRAPQNELAMQNEELGADQLQAEALRAHDVDLFNLAPMGYVTVNTQGDLLETNTAAATLLGIDGGLLVPQPISRFIHQEDQHVYDVHRKMLIETGMQQTSELRMIKQDGTAFWARLKSVVAHDEDGKPVYRIVVHDITRRKRAEEELRQSEQFAYDHWVEDEATLEAIPANIALLDINGVILRVNTAWTAFARDNGAVPEAMGVGANYLAVCDAATGAEAELATRFAAGIRSVIHGTHERFSMEYPCHSPKHPRWFMGYVTPTLCGSAARAVVAHVDISALKIIEEQIRVLNQDLEKRVGRRTAKLKETVEALEAEIAQRHRLEREILEISEREQCRFGQALHDGVDQELAGTAMLSEALTRQLQAESHPLAKAAAKITAYIRTSIDSTRILAKGLYPIELNRYGLLLALKDLADQTSRRTGICCELRQNGEAPQLAKSAEIHIYRIVQEGIANAVKHARPRHIVIESLAGDGSHTFAVTDDGVGFEKPLSTTGMGLHLMEYRARVIGAQIDL
jgi:PAS domain S-box-containing protein